MTLLAYRFALDPAPTQARALRSHAGAARVAFNWGLARVKAVMSQRAAEATYGITGDDLTPNISWTLYSLRKDWNAVKDTVAPWWAECSKEAFNTGLDALARALKNWNTSCTGKRKGKPVGFPRFRSRHKTRPSIRFTTGAFRCETAHAGETFEVPNPRHLTKALRKVRRLSRTCSLRRGPDRRTGQRPSNRWRRADAARNRALGQVADQRKDSIHKLTTGLARTYGTLVVEDLHVAGMLANRRLARHVADASFAEIRRQLTYKTAWHGGTLIVADRWFASSKTCSACGTAKTKLALSERTYRCTACGLVLDRDVNAARNLAEYGKQHLAASGADGERTSAADRKTGLARQVAVKRQPGTRQRGQTGTLPPQGESAA